MYFGGRMPGLGEGLDRGQYERERDDPWILL